MAVTTLDKIKEIATPEVKLSGWNGETFVCRLKRVSMLDLLSKGKIPNSLLGAASELFQGKRQPSENGDIKEIAQIIDIFAENALVEPTVEDLNEIGVNLTDNQKIEIFNYCTEGIKKLTPSDKKQEDSRDN
ncbi:esterase (plasmid) [Haloimpatiens sp. FM7330]|uniref:esterase n=1 Tax=Haloimpatiens sp. FM7330 TaxID=3298610 RepID=UPI00363AF30D